MSKFRAPAKARMLVDEMKHHGFALVGRRANGHLVFSHPVYGEMTTAATPRSPSGAAFNARSAVRRLQRAKLDERAA